MRLIEAQGPRTVVLGILLLFYLDFILFYHISVSGQYCPNYRRVLEQQVKRCERLSASTIGATQKTILALRCTLCLQAKRCALATPLGEASAFAAPIFRFLLIFHICRASPICSVRIITLIVLAQHKRNERISEARTQVRRVSPIVIELAYIFRCTDRKQKYVRYKTTTNSKFKIMPSATVLGQYPMIGAILNQLQFSLNTSFKWNIRRELTGVKNGTIQQLEVGNVTAKT